MKIGCQKSIASRQAFKFPFLVSGLWLLTFACLGLLSAPAQTCLRTVAVNSTATLNTALASALPGDCIILANGNYAGFTMSLSGTAAHPITIRAANQGQAVINSGTVRFNGVAHVTVEGLTVTTSGGSATVGSDTRRFAVWFNSAQLSRLTRCTFALSGQSSSTYWVFLSGDSKSNRVDHCEFGPNSASGNKYIFVCGNRPIPGVTPPADRTSWAEGNGAYNPNMARYTRVDHNHFRDKAAGTGEIIDLGGLGVPGDYQDTYSLLEFNLIENCDGDAEIIAIKSSRNTVRYNTVRTSAGMLSSRAGNNNSIHNNFMLQGGKPGSGGIKLYEKDHQVYNNYIEATDDYPLLVGAGDSYDPNVSPTNDFGHAQVFRAWIAHNTVVNCGRQVRIGHGSTDQLPPTDCVFANNVIVGASGATLFSQNITPVNLIYTNNLIWPQNPNRAGFTVVNPQLSVGDGILKLSSGSPAINAAHTNYFPFITEDVDGQPRVAPDIGADEFSAAAIGRRPLTTNDVGPLSGLVNFSLASSPTSGTVNAGVASNVTYTITVTNSTGSSESVSLGVSGLPANSSASFSPSTVVGTGSSTLTVFTSNSTPAGNFALNITGTNSNFTNVTTASLIVAATNSLVAYLTFDNGTANDSSSHGNHGVLLNGAAIVTDPQRGNVLALDGVDDYVSLGNAASLDLSDDNQATIAAWIRPAVSKNHNTILSKGEWKEAYALVVKGDTTPKDQLWTGNDTSVFSGTPVPTNVWTHVAVTINGNLATFYINGQLAGTMNQNRGNPIDNTATGVCIGRDQFSGAMPAGRWFFNGQLDDVRLYERALAPVEIQSVMVGSLPVTAPRIVSSTWHGVNLVLSGTNGVPGAAYFVLTSPDLTLPLASWTRAATNVFDLNGSFTFTNPITPGTLQQFYLLQVAP